jgi:hypothetical protein
VRFERLPVALDESLAGQYVGVKHGVEAGQKIVSNGADALAQQM